MSRGKEKGYPGFQVGTSFLLVIFVIICLVLLGVLSLSGALRDKSYSDRVIEKTGLYYEAVSEAQHKLGEIDRALSEMSSSENMDRVVSELGYVVWISNSNGEPNILSYEVPITDSQVLRVEVEVLDPEKGEGNYKIVKWQEASESVWEDETTLPVLQFDEE